ncbi:MAG: hypothetical protein ABI471_12160 [Sphingomonas bacterium]
MRDAAPLDGPGTESSSAPAPQAGSAPAPAAPRVNDAMRVLSRMQTDLDVLTEGKRAATYAEVDDAFGNAIKALGISLPPAGTGIDPDVKAAAAIAAPATGGNARERGSFAQNAMEEEQRGPGIDTSLSIATPPVGANPVPLAAPAAQAEATASRPTPAEAVHSGASPVGQIGPAPTSGPSVGKPNGGKIDLWQSGMTVVSPAGLPVGVTGLNLTQGDYLDAVKKGLWSRVEGDDSTKTGLRDDQAVAAASAGVQKHVPVSAADISSGDELRRFIKEIAKPTATAALHGKRNFNDDFERFFTIGRNGASQLVITSIHVVGRQGAHVISLMPAGSISIAHYHGAALVQPPNSGDNSAVRSGNISSFVIGNGGDTVWEIGRVKGREVFREIGRGGVPGRWQRYQP